MDFNALSRNTANNALNYFQFGQQLGQQVRADRQAQERKAAIAGYAVNPDDPKALQGVIAVDQEMGMKLAEDQRKRALETRQRELTGKAAQGDNNAILELYGVAPEVAARLDDRTKKQAIDGIKYIGDAAYQIVQLPEQQRAAAWDAYIDQGVSMFPGLAQYKGKYSPQALNSIVSQAGQMKEFQTFQQPKYAQVGENGLAGFQYGKPLNGTDGKPQNFGPALPQGFVVDGGPTPPASGNFRP